MRVRTTSLKAAPAFTKAASIFRMVCTVCAYTSPTPTILPSGPIAVVPDTLITFPTRTAREYPTIGSHGAPLEIFWRATRISSTALSYDAARAHAKLYGLWHTVCHDWCACPATQ